MAAIQQSINQLLYSANIGAGFASQTPETKGRYEARAAEEKGRKKVSAISSYIDEFMASQGKAKEEVWTKEHFTPETFKQLKGLHTTRQKAAATAWNANPNEETFNDYLQASKANKEITELGIEWGFIEKKKKKSKATKGRDEAVKAGMENLETSTATKAHMANVRKEEANNG